MCQTIKAGLEKMFGQIPFGFEFFWVFFWENLYIKNIL